VLGAMLTVSAVAVPVVPPAKRFVTCYQALGRSAEPLSAWERLTFSYLLARSGELARTSERADLGVRPFRP
jgi:hypothetical protein